MEAGDFFLEAHSGQTSRERTNTELSSVPHHTHACAPLTHKHVLTYHIHMNDRKCSSIITHHHCTCVFKSKGPMTGSNCRRNTGSRCVLPFSTPCSSATEEGQGHLRGNEHPNAQSWFLNVTHQQKGCWRSCWCQGWCRTGEVKLRRVCGKKQRHSQGKGHEDQHGGGSLLSTRNNGCIL